MGAALCAIGHELGHFLIPTHLSHPGDPLEVTLPKFASEEGRSLLSTAAGFQASAE